MTRWIRLAYLVGPLALVLALATPVLGQGGPFSSQIENFWRVISTGGRTFTTLSATTINATTVNATTGGTITGAVLANPTTTGQILSDAGSLAAPTYSFTTATSTGMRIAAGPELDLVLGGGKVFALDGTTGYLLKQNLQIGTGLDAGFTRLGAASIGLGTGAANDFSGTLKLTTMNAVTTYQVNGTPITAGTTFLTSGSGMSVANVGANSCGTTAATIVGNNNVNVTTVGATAGTQCRVAFTVTAATEWDCTAADDTTTVAVRTTPVDTTHTDLIGTFTAGDKVTAICFPR